MNIPHLILRSFLVLVLVAGGKVMAGGVQANQAFQGTAVSEKSGRTWAAELTIQSISGSGEFQGTLAWPSLGSVNAVQGVSRGNTLLFKETNAIKKGSAHLNTEYALVVDRNTLKGRWIEPGSDGGTLELSAQTAKPQPKPQPVSVYTGGMKFSGIADSSQSGKTWPATLEIGTINPATGAFQGSLAWPSLQSVHRIDGKISGNTMTFKETQHIKAGGAHLGCEYKLVLQGKSLTGTWVEPGADKGAVRFTQN